MRSGALAGRGHVKQFGLTEPVLGAYDVHSRLRNAETAHEGGASDAPAPDNGAPLDSDAPAASGAAASAGRRQRSGNAPARDDGSARILSVDIQNLGEPQDGGYGRLSGKDLIAHIVVRGRGNERPNVGFMIEQSKGVGITSLATHEEGAAPVSLGDGLWRSVLTFPGLPLHSGDYVISTFLFDESGLVVYDEWFQFLNFNWVAPTLMPGLVKLPHHWG